MYVHYIDINFVELLKYRFERHLEDGFMLDIYDGCVHQDRYEFFSDPCNISFSLNYDGAPKFKSSNMQIWPIQLCINELPPKLRYVVYNFGMLEANMLLTKIRVLVN